MRSSIYGIPSCSSCNLSFTQNFISSRAFVLCRISWKRRLDRSLLRFPRQSSSSSSLNSDSIEKKISHSYTHRFIGENKSKISIKRYILGRESNLNFSPLAIKKLLKKSRTKYRKNCFRGKYLVLFPTFLFDHLVYHQRSIVYHDTHNYKEQRSKRKRRKFSAPVEYQVWSIERERERERE